MAEALHDLPFEGCAPDPLAHYLKALGLLKIVSSQLDPDARGFWIGDVFAINSRIDKARITSFFLEEYAPTPVVAPWNGGSGFYLGAEKSNEKDEDGHYKKTGKRNKPTAATLVVDAILASQCNRLAAYRQDIRVSKEVLRLQGLLAAPKEEKKDALILTLRNSLSDAAIGWIDASAILTSDGPEYSPLLGSGGNDGNAEFSSWFMQMICKVLDTKTGDATPSSKLWLENALFGVTVDNLSKDDRGDNNDKSGQFFPSATGGANAGTGFTSGTILNPWEYILLVEGAIVFAGAAVRKLENKRNDAAMAFPFSVRPVASGYGTAAHGEKTRSELWLPTWGKPASINEIKALFSEGRADFGGRSAKNSIEFAQSIAALGTDRGLTNFHRYVFIERNGLNYFAVKLDAFNAREDSNAILLGKPIEWIGRNRRSKDPEGKKDALRKIEENLLRLCHRGFDKPALAIETIAALGRLMQERGRRNDGWNMSFKLIRFGQPPASILDAGWLEKADDGSPEFRLAASLAALLHPQFVSYLAKESERKGNAKAAAKDVGKWLRFAGKPIRRLNVMMTDRITRLTQEGMNTYAEEASIRASLNDVNAFIDGLDYQKIIDLTFGLALLDWAELSKMHWAGWQNSQRKQSFPGAAYAFTKLCHTDVELKGRRIRLVPAMHNRLASGNGRSALKLAVWRLRASGYRVPQYGELVVPAELCERVAAALLFPLDERSIRLLENRVLEKEVVLYESREIE